MSIPSRELPRAAWRRILREIRTRIAPRAPKAIEVGSSVQEIAADLRLRQTPRFFGLFPEQAALLSRFFPDAAYLTIEKADLIRAHKFDLLGSGEVDLGQEIDWHTDFKSGYNWPLEHHTRLTLTDPQGGFDVKVPWELSRFHHAIRLGQVYLYTLDEAYAEEITAQITHWIEKNPVEFGVNWAGPMDVAIRVVNWIWAYYLILEAESLTEEFLALWLSSLRQHGEYLVKNLEDSWPRTNHLIADLTGLAYLGILFPEFHEASKWRSIGITRLWQELARQVNPDGMSYEASTSYHRLVTEMALSVAGLCIINDIEVPETTRARLGLMLDVIMMATRPDGTVPMIGDADDGRLVPLSVYADPAKAVNDHRHLLALGSLVLERELSEWAGYIDPQDRGWSAAAGDEWQDAFWYFTSDAAARYTDVITQTVSRPDGYAPDDWIEVRPGVRVRVRALSRRPILLDEVIGSQGFEASGLYVMRSRNFHLTVDAGDVGLEGAGGHAHNDTLSLTLDAYGRPFLIDPGAYVYTADPVERNRFRSTATHNTLQIGDEEINPIPASLFRLPNRANITIHHWITHYDFDLLDASHDGYRRLSPGVTHRRQIWFDKRAGLWLLHDALKVIETGEHSAEAGKVSDNGADGHSIPEPEIDMTLWLHFAPMPIRPDRTNNAIRTENPDGPNLAVLPLGEFPLKVETSTGWISKRYGIKEEAPVAKFAGRVKLPADLVVLLYPHEAQTNLAAVRTAGLKALTKMQEALTLSLNVNGSRPEI